MGPWDRQKEGVLGDSISQRFLASAGTFGEKTAILSGERTLSFAQYAGAALKVAAALETRGEEERVAVLLPTSDAFAIVFFGIMLSGRVAVPLNFFLTSDELSFILADCGAKTLITSRFFEESTAGLAVDVVYAEEFLPQALELEPASPAEANPTATMLYTSGTTGRPKGVVLSHENVLANITGIVEHFHFDPSNVLLSILPLFHTFALTTTLALPAVIGATAVLMPRFDPAGTLKTIEANRVTTMVAVPSMYRALLKALSRGDADLSSLIFPISGGEPLGEDVSAAYLENHGITILEGYGMTETSPVVAANTKEHFKPSTVGRALPNVEVLIADEAGRDAGVDTDGEILVKAPSVMKGYHNLPDETKAAVGQDGFLRTGDIGRLDEDGFLKITGRKKEMIISAGENIFPREIERVLIKHPAVAEAAVIGIAHKSRGEAPKAFVVLGEGASVDTEELQSFCRESLARFKVPAEIEFRDALPHSPTGKILKRRLAEEARAEGGE